MSAVQALIIEPGKLSRLEDIEPDLPTLNKLVGGWLEGVDIHQGWHAYINEEGKLRGMSANMAATLLCHTLGWPRGDVLVGTVVFLGTGRDGSEKAVPQAVIDTARGLELFTDEPAGE